MADVAVRAGVSRALVSTVFRGVPGASASTRDRVLSAAADLGFRPDNRARSLRQGRTRLLGVTFDVQDAFHADLLVELYRAAAHAGYQVTLSGVTPGRPQAVAVQALLDERCEALLLLSPAELPPASGTGAPGVPVIALSRSGGTAGIDVVRCADDAVVDLALDHLSALGHTSVAHLDGGTAEGAPARRASWRRAVTGRGLAGPDAVRGGTTELDGRHAVEELLAGGPLPTALVAYNDRSAIGALFALRQAGLRVPQDVSVVGFDDVQMSALPHVDLTTIGQNAAATADEAVHRAVARLDQGDDPGHDVVVSPYLVVRGTTGAPAHLADRR